MIRLKDVPAARGAQWVRSGFKVFFRRPLVFSGLFAGFLVLTMLVTLIVPLVGGLVALASMPLLTLGFMKATHIALHDGQPSITVFVEPLRAGAARRNALIRLGLAYGVTMLIAFTLSEWVAEPGPADPAGVTTPAEPASGAAPADPAELETLATPERLRSMLLVMVLGAVLSIPFWHAPALVHWGGQGVAQALFSSTLAVWRARNAFVVYALAWTAVIALFGLLTSIVFGLLIGNPQMMGVAALPGGLIFSTVFYASLYFTFIDCFEIDALALD
jgi:hypothetical protein